MGYKDISSAFDVRNMVIAATIEGEKKEKEKVTKKSK